MGSSNKKFEDYFLSTGMPVRPPLYFHSGGIIEARDLVVEDETVELQIDLDLLMDVFPYDLISCS